eukprot:GDKI01015958.1.p1 GENE.GDKI01015958.1~~GDKI01015958.1.p1  ORF type:complete len:379 (-),score=141.84 GDKI01015958.1:334-1470(-)
MKLSALLPLFGLCLLPISSINGAAPKGFGKESTMYMNVDQAETSLTEMILDQKAGYLHVQWDAQMDNGSQMFRVLKEAMAIEKAAWESKPPITLVIESTEDMRVPRACEATLYRLNEALDGFQLDASTQDFEGLFDHFEVIRKEKKDKVRHNEGPIRVYLTADFDPTCFNNYVLSGGDNNWRGLQFVHMAPKLLLPSTEKAKQVDLETLKNKELLVGIVSRPWPRFTGAGDQIGQYINELPKDAKLLLTDLPTDPNAPEDRQKYTVSRDVINVLEEKAAQHPGRLLWSVEATVAETETPETDINDGPTPIKPEEEKAGEKEKEGEEKEGWKFDATYMHMAAAVGGVLLLGGAFCFMCRKRQKREGLVANEAPSAATRV